MKARLFMFMALVLGLVSCQNEPDEMNVLLGGEQEVMLTVSLPEATRADSADGALDNSVLTNYDLRYILEVYYGEDCNRFVQTSTSTSAVFPVRLAPGRTYTFVVWADFVTKGANAEQDIDLFYETSAGLKAIQIVEDKWAPMVEARDAYVGSKTIADFQTSSNLEMTLTRPFAKVRVVSTDIEQLRGVGIVPTTAWATYSQNMYRKFNAATGVASDAAPKTHTFAYANVDSYEANTDSKLTIFSDYIFVPAEGVAKFTLDVLDGETPARYIKQNNFNTDIYVEKNKVTTIVGDVLTTGGNVKVTINGDLGEKETISVVDTAEALMEQLEQLEDDDVDEVFIELGGDIDLGDLFGAGILSTRASEPTYGLLIPADKEVVLDLKGYTISQTKTQTTAYSMIDNRGTLIIKDSSEAKTGKLNYTDNGQGGEYASNTLNNSGVLTIESGTIENNSSATVAANGYPHPIDNSGTLVINGGTFTNNANYSSMRIWCTTDDNTIVTIDGGTFNGSIDFQTPSAAANKGTLTIKGGTFNADTYTKTAVRLLGFGADVDEMNGYIMGGVFNGAIALRNWSGSDFNSKVFNITGGTFSNDPSEFVDSYYVAVERDGKWVVDRRANVAKVGDVEYTFLSEAVNAATNGATITLLADVVLDETLVIAKDKVLTFDLAGKTISMSKECTDSFSMIDNKGTLNITDTKGNGMLTFTDTSAGGGSEWGSYTINNTGTLEVSNVTIEHLGSTGDWGDNRPTCIPIQNYAGKVTVNSGVISSPMFRSLRDFTAGGEIIINGGEFKGQIWMQGLGTGSSSLTINGGEFAPTAGYDGSSVYVTNGTNDVEVAITGGFFNTKIGCADASKAGVKGSIKGGIFTTSAKANTNAALLAEGYIFVDNGNDTWSIKADEVAKIGETKYSTLTAAIEAAESGATITLLRNLEVAEAIVVPEGKEIVLDLNGKTITATDYAIENYGTLKINGNGTINGIVYCEATGNTIVENGTFNAAESGKYVFLNSEGTLTINGGSSYPVYSYNSGSKLVINDATVNATFGCINSYGTGAVVEVNGGTFEMTGVQGKTSHIAYFSNVDVTINGGTFSKKGDINMRATGGGGVCAIYGANLTINGGNFAGDHADVYDWGGQNANGRAVAISIKGGSYKFEPNIAFVAEGYKATKISDNKYVVDK